MKFIDFLKSVDEWEGDVSTENFESPYTFSWGNDVFKITPAGRKYFAKIWNSEIKIPRNDLVVLLSKDITEEEFDYFSSAIAGYIPNSQFEKYFGKIV